jgi:hypothetical protein
MGVVAVLVTLTSAAQFTVIFTGPEVLLLAVVSVSELTVAVLLIAGQFPVEVVAVSVMDLVACGAIVPKLQVSVVPPATGEAGEQLPPSVPPTVQVSPAGNASVRTTLVELAGPLAVTVMPYVAWPPAVTMGVMAVLMTLTSAAQFTVILTGPDVLLLGFVSASELTVAVLLMAGQAPVEVVAVRVMDFVACGAMVPKLQISVVPPTTGEAGEQLALSVPPTVQVSPAGNESVNTTFVESLDPLAVTTTL